MSPIIQPAAPDHVIVRLTEAEMSDPIRIIDDLCDEYPIGKVRAILWQLVETALMEDGVYNNAQKRTELLEWHKKMEKALEALYIFITFAQNHSPLEIVS